MTNCIRLILSVKNELRMNPAAIVIERIRVLAQRFGIRNTAIIIINKPSSCIIKSGVLYIKKTIKKIKTAASSYTVNT